MVRRNVLLGRKRITIALDEYRPAGQRLWAIVKGRLIDEMTGRPIATRIAVETKKEGLKQRSVTGGIAGLTGVPQAVFSHPDLATNAHDFTVNFRAEGYLPAEQEVTLGPIAGFPDDFAPASPGDIELHRHPVIIRGRVMQSGTPPAPLTGLTVHIQAIWLRLPSATANPPADPYTVVAINPGIQFPRTAATTILRRRDLIDVLGEDKWLLEDSTDGSQRIRCSNRVNLAPGDILAVDVGDSSIVEYVPIDSIAGASTADQPAEIMLEYPLVYAHRRQAVVRRVNPQPPGGDNTFGVAAISGDTCVLLTSNTDLAGAQTVVISGGNNPDEYRRIFPFSTKTDGDGYFQLPPLSRVAQLDLRIHGGALSADIDEFVPDYGRRENWIDVMI